MASPQHRLHNWTLKAENLGRVKSATIEAAPFVVLVGKNNTGKSYIASTIWALHDVYDLLSAAKISPPAWYTKFVDEAFEEKSSYSSITIDGRRSRSILSTVNKALKNPRNFLQEVFQYDGFARTEISIEPAEVPSGFVLSFQRVVVEAGDDEEKRISATLVAEDETRLLSLNYDEEGVNQQFLAQYMFAALAGAVLFGGRNPSLDALYIPAGRTGLLLAQKAIGYGGLSSLFSETSQKVTLPGPVANFMQRLSRPMQRAAPDTTSIADWLESNILRGEVLRDKADQGKLFYRPQNAQYEVPLHATSSMITELAPFLMLLRRDIQNELIVFEEPEAHLHISAQRALARALARLVNTGRKVVITTHSDTFVQQINNLIQLYDHPERDKLLLELGYNIKDLIDPSKCRGYEFVEGDHHSEVRPLALEPEGFVVPSLNDTLVSLASETLRIQEDDVR